MLWPTMCLWFQTALKVTCLFCAKFPGQHMMQQWRKIDPLHGYCFLVHLFPLKVFGFCVKIVRRYEEMKVFCLMHYGFALASIPEMEAHDKLLSLLSLLQRYNHTIQFCLKNGEKGAGIYCNINKRKKQCTILLNLKVNNWYNHHYSTTQSKSL